MSAVKLDLRKLHRECYQVSDKDFQIVCVPRMQFLMIDGCGDPTKQPQFGQCVEALYCVAYTLKFMLKGQHEDYVVPPLEGLWWMDDPHEFSLELKDQWKWTLMIAQPDFISAQMVEQAMSQAREKKPLALLNEVRLASYEEGLACQILHIGPYENEADVIQRMHAFIHLRGHHLRGKHHEIYMNDPRRLPPDKYKTILRQAIM